MRKVNRRQFVITSLAGVGALWSVTDRSIVYGGTATDVKRNASDQVVLGNTGIHLSRLALGSGTSGSNHFSDQVRLGIKTFSDLLCYANDQGVIFWESADQCGSHEHLNAGMRRVGREKIVILTKTHARTASQMRGDLDRFRIRQAVQLDCLDAFTIGFTSRSRLYEVTAKMPALSIA